MVDNYAEVGIPQPPEERCSEMFILVDRDGSRHSVPKGALLQCSFFKSLINDETDISEFPVDATKRSVKIFRSFLCQEPLDDIEDAFEVISFACSIECNAFTLYCARAATGVDTSGQCLEKSMTVVGELIKCLPLRTPEHYKGLLPHLKSAEDRNTLADTVRAVLNEKIDCVYQPLPLPLFTNKVIVALMLDCRGDQITACLYDSKWIPVDIFGAYFSPFKEGVKNFYLRFNQYVVYETTTGFIKKKNLHSKDPAELLFSEPGCRFFTSRFNQLHIVRNEGDSIADIVYKWDHSKLAFVKKFSSDPSWKIERVDIAPDGKLLLRLEGSVVVKLMDDGSLYSIERCRYPILWPCAMCTLYGISEDALSINIAGQWRGIEPTDRIGYNITTIMTVCSKYDIYETKILAKTSNGSYTSSRSQLHGKVITVSDVLIL